jgi:uncharacterized protein YbjT (DUF2867 family)
MFTVFGATGTVGRLVVAELVARGEKVRAFARDPARAGFGPGVEIAVGDLADSASVEPALAGADGVFMLSSGPDALTHDLTVAEHVARQRVSRVVKLSSVAAMPPVTNAYSASHARAEAAFAATGTELTVLRCAAFMSNLTQWSWSIAAENRIYHSHGEIPRAMIDPADIAAVAALALCGNGFPGIHQLTGPVAYTAPDAARAVSAVLGRELDYVEADPALGRQAMIGAGLPADFVDGLLTEMAIPDPERGGVPLPTVLELLGREPRSLTDWLAEHKTELTG